MEDQQSPSNECTAAALGTMTNCGASALRDSCRENNGDESSLTKLLYTIVGKHRMRGARQIRSVTSHAISVMNRKMEGGVHMKVNFTSVCLIRCFENRGTS